MPEAVEGDVLADAGVFEPVLQGLTGHLAVESFEDETFAAFSAKLQGFGRDG